MGRTPKFKGWDFTELLTAWDLPMSENGLDDKADLKTIKEYIFSKFDVHTDKLDKNVKKDIKMFIKALIKCEHGYYNPIWNALLEIEDDFTFANLFCTLLPHMWT